MSDIRVTAFGRFRVVVRDGVRGFLFECPGCGTWASLDDDQWHGRVSVDHAADGCTGGYHETHDFATAVLLVWGRDLMAATPGGGEAMSEPQKPRMVEFPLSEFHLRRALYVANRDRLWPVGLALVVTKDDDGTYIRLHVSEWDFGDGRVEVIEDPEPEFDAEWWRFVAERRAKMPSADLAISLAKLGEEPALATPEGTEPHE